MEHPLLGSVSLRQQYPLRVPHGNPTRRSGLLNARDVAVALLSLNRGDPASQV